MGIGRAGALRRRFPDIADDADALQRIANGGASAQSRENNAGLGIEHLRSITSNVQGELTVVSGKAIGIVSRPR